MEKINYFCRVRYLAWSLILLLLFIGEIRPVSAVTFFAPTDIDLTIAEVKVIQGTSLSPPYAISIADRMTMVRVFVSTGSGDLVWGVTAKMCAYDGGANSLGCLLPANGSIVAPSVEEILGSTINFDPPANWLKPGNTFFITLDPDNRVIETDEGNNRFPAGGTQPFGFQNAPPLNIMVVPVAYKPFESAGTSEIVEQPASEQPALMDVFRLYLPLVRRDQRFGAGYFLPETDDTGYLTYLPIKVLPVPSVNYTYHQFYIYAPTESRYNLDSFDGWSRLLEEIQAVHAMEDPDGINNYFGLVNTFEAHGCNPSCITGVGYLIAKNSFLTAVGWSGFGPGTNAASETLVHELGHNFGRRHVLCAGIEPNPDPNYPYPGGSIGQFGLDVAEGVLFDPANTFDYMSYCFPRWTSDYTFWNVYQYRRSLSNQMTPVFTGDTLFIRGEITPEGEVTLLPVYRQQSLAQVSRQGAYSLELFTGEDKPAKSYRFDPYEIGDAPGYLGFGLAVPAMEGLSALRVRGPGGEVLAESKSRDSLESLNQGQPSFAVEKHQEATVLRWGAADSQAVYRLRLSLDDGQTWQVLALDWSRAEFVIPAEFGLDLDQALVEIQASDGVQTVTQTFEIPGEHR